MPPVLGVPNGLRERAVGALNCLGRQVAGLPNRTGRQCAAPRIDRLLVLDLEPQRQSELELPLIVACALHAAKR